jgi:hypothetical protein
MERISIITHKDLRIVVLDGKNLQEDELCKSIEEHCDIAIKNKIIYWITDVTNTHSTPKVRDTAEKSMKKAFDQLGTFYSVIIGLSSIQRLIAKAVNRNQHFTANMEDAKEWLTTKATVTI